MASANFPCNKACTARCMPHPGQLSPVNSLKGHLGINQYSAGLRLYKVIPPKNKKIINSTDFFKLSTK